ncbi:MAG: hypothetical protein ACTHJ0_16970 [Flavipsychrobacter sp.]
MRLHLIILLLLPSATSFAQYSLSAQLGIGWSVPGDKGFGITGPTLSSVTTGTISTAAIGTIGIMALKRITPSTDIGAAIYYQHYVFSYQENEIVTASPNMTINYNSSYLFVAPAIEFWGRNIVSFGLQPSAGILLHGRESTVTDSAVTSTSTNVARLVFQLNTVLREHIRVGKGWQITISENFGYMFGRLTSSEGYSNTPLCPVFISLQIGVLRHNKL